MIALLGYPVVIYILECSMIGPWVSISRRDILQRRREILRKCHNTMISKVISYNMVYFLLRKSSSSFQLRCFLGLSIVVFILLSAILGL